jgi:hypothetical protein
MKRFWLVMLSLGLVLAFSASAMAVDVKFSGSFYAAGMYLDKTSLNKDFDPGAVIGYSTVGGFHYLYYGSQNPGISTAFYYQRLRVQTDFIVSPGLKLVTRFDAMERAWGAARGNAATAGILGTTTNDSQSAGTMTENQNIAFDWAYIYYTSPIGLFEIGYQADNGWGTVFGNNAINGASIGKISYTVPIGPFYINATVGKNGDNSYSAIRSTTATDTDNDSYSVCAIYVPTKDIQIGLLGGYKRVAGGRAAAFGDSLYILPAKFNAYAYSANPYFKVKFGPVAVEGEVNYVWGQANWEGADVTGQTNIVNGLKTDINNLSVYLNAIADFGMFYGGATFAYVSGDDTVNTLTSKMEGGFIDGGVDFQPCLIMFNSDRAYWAGNLNGVGYAYSGMMLGSQGPAPNGGVLANAWFGQGKVGVRPIAPLDIMASVSYAQADQKNTAIKADYGWEVDVTGTYKLTNNLSYMLGAAYLFTGDYYRGTSAANAINNNYMLINKLTLTF